jgi:tetratricopeptide (TPR) repeat protein
LRRPRQNIWPDANKPLVAPLTLAVFLVLFMCRPGFGNPATIAHIDSLWTSGQRDLARTLLDEELPGARAEADSVFLSNLLVMKGAYNIFFGNPKLAESVLLEGVAMARARQDSTLLVSGLRWLGLAIASQGRRTEAIELYQELLERASDLQDHRHEGWANIGLAWANWRDGAADTALQQYERAAALFALGDDVQGKLWANNGIAAVSSELGRYDEATEGYLATIAVARAHAQPTPEAVALNNLGTLEYSLGRSDVAVAYFRQAQAIHAQQRNKRPALPPLFNIAMCQNELGQYANARQTLDEALAFCDTHGYRDMRCRTLVKIARLELQHKRLNSAEALIQDAMGDPETMLVRDVVEARTELGEAYRQRGNYEAAVRQFASADSLLADKQFSWNRRRLLMNRARVWRDLGEYRRALDQFLDLAPDATDLGKTQNRLAALAEAAATCLLMDRPDTARTLFEAAAIAWEKDRQQLLSPQWRERRGTAGRKIFTDLAVLIHDSGDQVAAFDRVQAYKSRTLLERMLGPGAKLSESLAQADAHHAQLVDLQATVLADDELLLDFTLGPRVSLVYAVTRDTLVLRLLPPSQLITDRVRAYYELLQDPSAGSPAALATVGAGLSELLLSDLPAVFADKKRFLVAPDGALNLLPFGDMEFSGHRPQWVRVPSASVLFKLRRDEREPPARKWRTLAIASGWGEEAATLTGTLAEVEHLARSFQHVKARVLEGGEAELPQLGGYDILHLAAHASNDDQSPWLSAIRFLPDPNSGHLRATDVLDLQLDARLVVLSSCSTGAGQILSGEGVLGFSTAFLSAGVPAVLASLWSVDDGATTQFMRRYYGFLAEGQDCARALTSTQDVLRAQPETRHPYYWAGFVLVGEGTIQPQLAASRGWLMPASIGLLALGVLVATLRWRSSP